MEPDLGRATTFVTSSPSSSASPTARRRPATPTTTCSRASAARSKSFTAGELNGTPITYDVSVHGSVFATATVDGQPYALSRERSTFGRDGLNLAALHDMTMGEAKTPKRFFKTANEFGFTFNWGYTSRNKTAYFSSGRLPERARGLDRRLPTLGTGDYEWKGFLGWKEHPHGVGGPGGLLLNWNNQSAPGFMHGDDDPYGSVHRVELFDQCPKQARITDNVERS